MPSLTAKHLPPHSFSNVSASVATYAATFSHTISSPLTMLRTLSPEAKRFSRMSSVSVSSTRTVVTATNSPRVLRRSWAAQSGGRASVATRLPFGLALPLASMASVRANFTSGSREYGLKNTSLWRILTLYTLKVMLLLR
jgi:hypothetical protein